MKSIIKKFPLVFNLSRKIYKIFKKKKVINYFKTNYSKNALLSYITYPFTRVQYLTHTNYYEAMSHAKILSEMGYNIDVIDYFYQGKIDFSKYDVLVGFGDAFQKYFESGYNHIKTIYYGTGMHVCHQNNATLKRVKDVYKKKGVWIAKSSRFVEKTWTHQTLLVDAMVVLGNEVSKESYRKFYDGPIYNIPAPFFKILDGYGILKFRDLSKSKYNFLWFGSSGLIHKGLDLVLDFFSKTPELTLHICGPIKNEPEFEKVYFKELYQTKNIITYGFININSKKFKEILGGCSFVIFPSCSEGGCSSVITAIGNGALIPIITKETTISTGYEIWIDDFTAEAVEKAVAKCLSLKDDEILNMQRKNLEYVLKYHSQENYYSELKKAYIGILGAML